MTGQKLSNPGADERPQPLATDAQDLSPELSTANVQNRCACKDDPAVNSAPVPDDAATTVLRVALPLPLPEPLDYLAPEPDDGFLPQPGSRVLVPFRNGQRVGVLWAIEQQTEPAGRALKRVAAVLDPRPLFSAHELALIAWAARYYQVALGEALFSALPGRLRRAMPEADSRRRGVRLTGAGHAVDPDTLRRAPRQRELLLALAARPEGLALDAMQPHLRPGSGPLRALIDKGLAEPCTLAAKPIASAPQPQSGPRLNPAQQQAVQTVGAALGGFRPFLLEGVTGSGKTEVYIRLAAQVIARGEQALVIVPEIGLTPQLRARFASRLPGPLAVLHSALGDGERARNWLAGARGEATLVLGTRSAVFAPLPRLALIVVDEEHDDSLKQQEGFRYCARDVAVRRAQLAGCPVVLGSATPTLETLHNAVSGRYRHLCLPQRAGGASVPKIMLLDIRDQPLRAGLSAVLRADMEHAFAAGNQVLLLLNRRGFAPVQTCHHCGWVAICPHCDLRLTLHLAERRLRCHHCGFAQPLSERCPECRSDDLRTLGRGTERLEDELAELFPDIALTRIDRDSTRRRGTLERLLERARHGEVQLLLGTQMLAKGHDFPGVTLVGILDIDQALLAGEFRAPERTAQLIVQVAGRAGRAERPGRVVVQTRHPEHPLLQALLTGGYSAFAESALHERRESELPPFSHLALLRADAPNAELALRFLHRAAELARAAAGERLLILGPVPAPLARRAGRHRAQLLVQASERTLLQRFLRHWRRQLLPLPRPGGLRWALDVDPRDMS